MGVDCGPARVDLARVRAWKDSIRRSQESWVEVLESRATSIVRGEASFVDAYTVRVGERELTARPDPDRDRLAHRGSADPRDRAGRVDRPHHGARARADPRVAARRRRRAGRARVRADLLALRLARHDRQPRRPDRRARRHGGRERAAGRARGGGNRGRARRRRRVRSRATATRRWRRFRRARVACRTRPARLRTRAPNTEALGLERIGVDTRSRLHRRRRPAAHERRGNLGRR